MTDKNITDQLRQMNADRAKLVARLEKVQPGSIAHKDLCASIRGLDYQAGKLSGLTAKDLEKVQK